jgi:hypothetical protein
MDRRRLPPAAECSGEVMDVAEIAAIEVSRAASNTHVHTPGGARRA